VGRNVTTPKEGHTNRGKTHLIHKRLKKKRKINRLDRRREGGGTLRQGEDGVKKEKGVKDLGRRENARQDGKPEERTKRKDRVVCARGGVSVLTRGGTNIQRVGDGGTTPLLH